MCVQLLDTSMICLSILLLHFYILNTACIHIFTSPFDCILKRYCSLLFLPINKVLAVVTWPLRNLDYDWLILSGGQNNLLQRMAMSEMQVVGCE